MPSTDDTIRGVAYYEGMRRAREDRVLYTDETIAEYAAGLAAKDEARRAREARPMTDIRRTLTVAMAVRIAEERAERRRRLVAALVQGAVCALVGFGAGLAYAEAWVR